MELFRQEYETRLGKNWGKEMFERLNAREDELEKKKSSSSFTKAKVRNEVEQNLLEYGPIDASETIKSLDEIELCDFFQKFPKCQTLILRNWTVLSDRVIRCLSISMGESLTDLDLSGSNIDAGLFEIIMARIQKLKILRISGCPSVNGNCMGTLARICQRTLIELHADHCPLFRAEPVQWFSGTMGALGLRVAKLSVLDLSHCPLEDKALVALGTGLHKIRFLNLCECSEITDVGVSAVVKGNVLLEVLNLYGCILVGNKAAATIGTYSSILMSLNIGRCAKITDVGLKKITSKCSKLQALNVAGILKLTEKVLYYVAENCPGILMLNVTGCEQITMNGVKELIRGLKYVTEAQSYLGFRPVDEHIDKKLSDQLVFQHNAAARRIQETYKTALTMREYRTVYETERQRKAALVIQQYFQSLKQKLKFYRLLMDKKMNTASITIQRVWRGVLGCKRAAKRMEFLVNRRKFTPIVLVIQKCYRGHTSRRRTRFVADAIHNMYMLRRIEAEVAAAIRLQTAARRFLAFHRIDANRELFTRRNKDMYNSALVIQCCGRVYLARYELYRRKEEKKRLDFIRLMATIRIQVFYRATLGIYNAKMTLAELKIMMRKRIKMAIRIQTFFRRYLAVQEAQHRRIQKAVECQAAITIQRTFRGARIMHWRDLRMNILSAFIFDRQLLERKDRIADARLRYQNFLVEVRRDSASEDDIAEEDIELDWVKNYDMKRRIYYWYNASTQEVTYEEPRSEIYHQKALIGKRVKIFWIMQNEWYTGAVTRYNRRKMKHRIEYTDGDHEWIDLTKEQDRVQVELEDGSWVMFRLYRPGALLEDWKKAEKQKTEEDYKALAYRDAQQWKTIMDDKNSERVMYVSTMSGELRTGTEDCLEWIIQDDGFGFPQFYNLRTGEKSHEDPRFVDDAGEDEKRKRTYIMSELRYTLYFCRDYWDRYNAAIRLGDESNLKSLMRMIAKSKKPKLLTALLLRAKVLYESSSVVDRAVDPEVAKEIEYCSWLVERLAEVSEKAFLEVQKGKDAKLKVLKKLLREGPQIVHCAYCKHETKRHLQFCKTCGRPQVFMN